MKRYGFICNNCTDYFSYMPWYPKIEVCLKGEVQWKTILRGIIDGITESNVIPSVLQFKPCSQRKQPFKIGLDKVHIPGIQIKPILHIKLYSGWAIVSNAIFTLRARYKLLNRSYWSFKFYQRHNFGSRSHGQLLPKIIPYRKSRSQ